ncbi:hypothetical protein Cob_v002644 [Colletotrichum orbiculare MAFF 240422]|uniref:Uncharacterized protein n=1 Tax=Colletotrichum orbiculare (strain 104-T / ATCC 96160 / CBS 514.97 / LARS 414 / MAFF 240422) TaxID=1213857 RepID=A0A484G3I9_COLOR|nr:hypothetical protein Cob_v002644 [Colletotrichum orbiculare MAFF 240422]
MRFASLFAVLASALVVYAQDECNNDKKCGGRDCTINPGGTAGQDSTQYSVLARGSVAGKDTQEEVASWVLGVWHNSL